MSGLAASLRRAVSYHRALVVLLCMGAVVRMVTLVAYQPAALNLADSLPYLETAHTQIFGDGTRPPGYPAFLRFLSLLAHDITWTLAVQHVLGLVTGVVIYATTLRLGAPRWAACVPAAAVILAGDQIFLEHAVMTETLFTLLVAGGLYCGVRALDAPRRLRGGLDSRLVWLSLAGAFIGLSAWTRSYSMVLVGPLALWCLVAFGGWSLRRRALAAVAVVAGGVATLALLAGIRAAYTSEVTLTGVGGWALYSRTAQFADCEKFTPPKGTARLCQRVPPRERPGPDWYGFEPASPARRLFGAPPNGNDELAAFGRAAALNQPVDYARTVFTDLMRFFAPGFGLPRPWSGPGYEVLDFRRRAGALEQNVTDVISLYYDDEQARLRAVDELHDYQEVFRFGPTLLLLSVLLGAAGAVVAAARLRWGIVLLGGTGLLLLLVPVASAIYTARYAIPADGPIAAAGILGVLALLRRAERRRDADALPDDRVTARDDDPAPELQPSVVVGR